jgi:hypothetical protein
MSLPIVTGIPTRAGLHFTWSVKLTSTCPMMFLMTARCSSFARGDEMRVRAQTSVMMTLMYVFIRMAFSLL